jgi:general secretion pathway protein H
LKRLLKQTGFTLIEILVVVFLVVLTVGVVAVNFRHDESRLVENEARRFAALVNQLCQESIIRGEVLAVTSPTPETYEFLVLDPNGWQPITGDDVFRARELQQDITLRLRIDEPGDSGEQLRCEPGGYMTPFSALFELAETVFRVRANEEQELEVNRVD